MASIYVNYASPNPKLKFATTPVKAGLYGLRYDLNYTPEKILEIEVNNQVENEAYNLVFMDGKYQLNPLTADFPVPPSENTALSINWDGTTFTLKEAPKSIPTPALINHPHLLTWDGDKYNLVAAPQTVVSPSSVSSRYNLTWDGDKYNLETFLPPPIIETPSSVSSRYNLTWDGTKYTPVELDVNPKIPPPPTGSSSQEYNLTWDGSQFNLAELPATPKIIPPSTISSAKYNLTWNGTEFNLVEPDSLFTAPLTSLPCAIKWNGAYSFIEASPHVNSPSSLSTYSLTWNGTSFDATQSLQITPLTEKDTPHNFVWDGSKYSFSKANPIINLPEASTKRYHFTWDSKNLNMHELMTPPTESSSQAYNLTWDGNKFNLAKYKPLIPPGVGSKQEYNLTWDGTNYNFVKTASIYSANLGRGNSYNLTWNGREFNTAIPSIYYTVSSPDAQTFSRGWTSKNTLNAVTTVNGTEIKALFFHEGTNHKANTALGLVTAQDGYTATIEAPMLNFIKDSTHFTGKYLDGKRIFRKYFDYTVPDSNTSNRVVERNTAYLVDWGGWINVGTKQENIRDCFLGASVHRSLMWQDTSFIGLWHGSKFQNRLLWESHVIGKKGTIWYDVAYHSNFTPY